LGRPGPRAHGLGSVYRGGSGAAEVEEEGGLGEGSDPSPIMPLHAEAGGGDCGWCPCIRRKVAPGRECAAGTAALQRTHREFQVRKGGSHRGALGAECSTEGNGMALIQNATPQTHSMALCSVLSRPRARENSGKNLVIRHSFQKGLRNSHHVYTNHRDFPLFEMISTIFVYDILK